MMYYAEGLMSKTLKELNGTKYLMFLTFKLFPYCFCFGLYPTTSTGNSRWFVLSLSQNPNQCGPII